MPATTAVTMTQQFFTARCLRLLSVTITKQRVPFSDLGSKVVTVSSSNLFLVSAFSNVSALDIFIGGIWNTNTQNTLK